MSSDQSSKGRLVFAAKVIVAVALIAWLVRGGKLDFGALAIYGHEPRLLPLTLGVFALAAVIGAFRYQALLRIDAIEVPFRTLLQLQLTAFFFNVVIPGNVGGDVVKALHVAREAPAERRANVFLLSFLERVIGVVALVVVGGLVVLTRPSLWADSRLRTMGTIVLLLALGLLAGGTLSLVAVQRFGHRLDAFTSGSTRSSKLVNRLVASLRVVSSGPKQIAIALALSMAYHAAAIVTFTAVLRAIVAEHIDYGAVATVFPLGQLSLMLPVSPAGLGVGHIVFEGLFKAIGIEGGATVFNVYVIGLNAPCLLGVFSFLTLKRRGELPNVSETGPRPD